MNRLISIGLSVAVSPAIALAVAEWTSSPDAIYVSEVALFDIALPLGAGMVVVGLIQISLGNLLGQFLGYQDNNHKKAVKKKIPIDWMFQYQHITGSILGLTSLLIFSVGWFSTLWPIIMVGSYSVGWGLANMLVTRLTPSVQQQPVAQTGSLTDASLLVLAKAEKRIPEHAVKTLTEIVRCVDELSPRLEDPMRFEGLKLLRRIVEVYLPVTLDNYLKLPAEFAKVETLSDGKTAEELLLGQLNLLAEHLQSMLKDTVMNDARAVIENGLFLEERFKAHSFFETK